ncbi:MAG: hypothetical protein ACRDKU_08370 [Gaiellaceae bacterium]
MDTAFWGQGQPPLRGAKVAPGDHLQTGYQLWLVGHQLERAESPWRDPYSFQPLVEPRANFAGWPFGLVYWPLHRAFGTVIAWNAFVLLGFLGAGSFGALWLRELGVRRGAALVGGLAFCLAPYLQGQTSAGHLLAWTAMLLPLALFAWERWLRRSTWWLALSAAALASIPLSGQVHLALGAIPFFCLYALLRGRALAAAAASAVLAVGAGLLVYVAVVRESAGAGRSFAQVERYSAEASDFLSRHSDWSEDFVFLGWLTPLLAAAGLAILFATRRYRLAAALAVGAVLPGLLAFGANLPGYETLWRNLPGLRETRVPERLMPIACLALAALVGFAVNRVRWPGTAALVAVLLLLDLRIGLFEATPADEDNRAYAALRAAPPGRLLEITVFLPDRQAASVYLYYLMQAPREHPTGYSTLAPREAARKLNELSRAPCRGLRPLGVRYLTLHAEARTCGGRLLARDGPVTLYGLTSP